MFGFIEIKLKAIKVKYLLQYKWLKLVISANMIVLLKATMSGISCISTYIFVNINCYIKLEASKFL